MGKGLPIYQLLVCFRRGSSVTAENTPSHNVTVQLWPFQASGSAVSRLLSVERTTMTKSTDMATPNNVWLKQYYTARALFSVLWVALAFTIGKASPPVGIGLIIAYPAWDSLANYIDALRNGGLRANPPQFLNMVVSAVVTLAVTAASTRGFHAIIAVVGIWAALSGLLQLSTAVRRWRSAGAQWPMILSGARER